jgi:hypothetical protein
MPLFDLFWTMLMLFLFIAWIAVLITVVGDVLGRKDIGGGLKAMWILIMTIVPWIGVLAYLFTAGNDMATRRMEAAKAEEEAMAEYIRQAAGTQASPADELRKLHELKTSGLLTDEEFAAQKASLLA